MEKVCSKCKEVKPLTEFVKRKRNKSGVGSRCNICANKQNQEYRKKVGYKDDRNTRYLRQYGITLETYNSMLEAQKGLCNICGSSSPRRKGWNHFCVDHCHQTGKIRGLLCGSCNSALGLMKDKKQILLNMIHYLEDHDAA